MGARNNLRRKTAILLAAAIIALLPSFTAQNTDPVIRVAISSNLSGALISDGGEAGLGAFYEAAVGEKADILLDFGNFYNGSPISDLANGENAASVASIAGYGGMALGPRDWLFGKEQLLLLEKRSGVPILAGNVIDTASNKPLFSTKYIAVVASGIKIGVFGIIGEDMAALTPDGYLAGISYADPVSFAESCASELKRDGCIAAVCLGQTYDEDLISKLSLIADLLIAPGDDISINGPVITLGSSRQSSFGLVEMRYSETQKKLYAGLMRNQAYEMAPKATSDVAKSIAGFEAKFNQALDGPLGESLISVPNETNGSGSETTLGRLVCDSYRFATNADIAFESSKAIGKSLPQGTLSYRDSLNALPGGGNIITVSLTGDEVLSVLEQSTQTAMHAQQPNASDPQPFSLHVSGVKYNYDPSMPMGKRVYNTQVQGEPLDLKKSYTAAINSQLAALPDYPVLNSARKCQDSIGCFSALSSYIQRGWFSASLSEARIIESPLPEGSEWRENGNQSGSNPGQSAGSPVQGSPGQSAGSSDQGPPGQSAGSSDQGSPGQSAGSSDQGPSGQSHNGDQGHSSYDRIGYDENGSYVGLSGSPHANGSSDSQSAAGNANVSSASQASVKNPITGATASLAVPLAMLGASIVIAACLLAAKLKGKKA
ncbi:MAG: 5'-nucleotidase C-terminal domain-containing protein [Eubacteriaceae bacterium]|nr:5'-nucleotidase C-terminal domain-containing protein [Eubacteriaceae bacterium]